LADWSLLHQVRILTLDATIRQNICIFFLFTLFALISITNKIYLFKGMSIKVYIKLMMVALTMAWWVRGWPPISTLARWIRGWPPISTPPSGCMPSHISLRRFSLTVLRMLVEVLVRDKLLSTPNLVRVNVFVLLKKIKNK